MKATLYITKAVKELTELGIVLGGQRNDKR